MAEQSSGPARGQPVRKLARRRRPQPGAGSERRSNGTATTLEQAQASIGHFIRRTREALHLTQAQVAEQTRQGPWQLSRAAVSAIERGQNFPGLEAMLALSSVLQIDPKELIERARLTAAVPSDLTGLTYEELESRASHYFWAGDFKRALAVYDAMRERLTLESPEAGAATRERLATLEIRRATTLKRGGALLSAIGCAERAISLAEDHREVQAEAYVVLGSLQCQRGHLPLARDAAARAIELSTEATPTRARAWMLQGQYLYQSRRYEEARRAFHEARVQAEASGDHQHLTHIDGNIGICWLAQRRMDEARSWIERAIRRAHERKQPALEASWMVELGRVALEEGRLDETERLAASALGIARPGEHRLTVFRAEWLRYRVARRKQPDADDSAQLKVLQDLYLELGEHGGIEEIQAFRDAFERGTGEGSAG